MKMRVFGSEISKWKGLKIMRTKLNLDKKKIIEQKILMEPERETIL